MTRSPFKAEVRRDEAATIVDLRGDLDGSAEGALQDAYGRTGEAREVRLNFADVGYINSTGIALIVSLLADARKRERTVIAYGLSEHYREIFEITRLADFMRIYPDERAAAEAAS